MSDSPFIKNLGVFGRLMAESMLSRTMDRVNKVKDRVSDTVGDFQDRVTDRFNGLQGVIDQELKFVELVCSIRPRFNELVEKGIEPVKAFKRAARELKSETQENKEEGDKSL